jgi:hypothetical protein
MQNDPKGLAVMMVATLTEGEMKRLMSFIYGDGPYLIHTALVKALREEMAWREEDKREEDKSWSSMDERKLWKGDK